MSYYALMISSLKATLALSAKQYTILAQATQSLEAAAQRGEFTAWSIACSMRLSDHTQQPLLVSCCYADEWLRAAPNHQSLQSSNHPVFDLASLTKPLLAGLSFCMLNGQDWQEKLFVPGIAAAALENLVLGQIALGQAHPERILSSVGDLQSLRLIDLFSHQSGLPAWRWFGRGLCNPDQRTLGSMHEGSSGSMLNFDSSRLFSFRRNLVAALLAQRETAKSPETSRKSTYSDCGYYLLSKILEAEQSQSTGAYWRNALERINESLGTQFAHASLTPEIAAHAVPFFRYLKTEDTGGRDASSFPSYGPCNDSNANLLACLGPQVAEVSSHAGLFGSVGDVWKGFSYLVGTLGKHNPSGSLSAMKNDRFCFCLDTPTGPSTTSAAPSEIAGEVFGHLGYTGTSAWFHRPTGNGWVLLTNRTSGRLESRTEPAPRIWRFDLGDQCVFAIQEPGKAIAQVSADDWLECRERHSEAGVLIWDSKQCGPFANISDLRRSTGALLWSFAATP
jgi:CubicO group peptidase (beta-lactamase class C family)